MHKLDEINTYQILDACIYTITHNNMIYSNPEIMKELANSFQKTGYILPFYKKQPTRMKNNIRLTLLIALAYIT
jgi:NH3-dependent NAD+ synthetase